MCWLTCSTQAQCQTQTVCSVFIRLMIHNKPLSVFNVLQFLWSLPLILPDVSLDQLLSPSSSLKCWASTWSQTPVTISCYHHETLAQKLEDSRRAEFLLSLGWILTRVTVPCLLATLNLDQTVCLATGHTWWQVWGVSVSSAINPDSPSTETQLSVPPPHPPPLAASFCPISTYFTLLFSPWKTSFRIQEIGFIILWESWSSNTLATSLEKTVMPGKIEGKRRREWQRMRWLDSITNSMDVNLSKLWGVVEDRGGWSAKVHGNTKSQTQLSDWIYLMF